MNKEKIEVGDLILDYNYMVSSKEYFYGIVKKIVRQQFTADWVKDEKIPYKKLLDRYNTCADTTVYPLKGMKIIKKGFYKNQFIKK